ncbi:MAG: hypothetical protein L6R28_10525 [Planctomycetes bacterium]|nr:hypothetical protein [Planctomycetota bacterium]
MDEERAARRYARGADRARFNLKNGNREAAKDYIDTIRGIDPGYKGLGDLEEDFKKLDPATGR